MIRDYIKLFWASISILSVLLGARLIWLTVTTETGFQERRREWRDANTAWIVGPTVPLDNQPTADQEDFWIREIDRILQVHGDDPQILVGAAVLLDSPIASAWGDNDGIRERLMRQEVIPDEPQEYYSGPNIRIGSGSKSLELIGKATELNPGNPEWWQIRALLATSPDYYTANGRRDQNLVATLDECLQHDPKNALYDFLATEVEWSPHRYSNPFNRPNWLIE